MITKPMLAPHEKIDVESLKFDLLLATPKLDGIRCLKIGGRAVTRKFLPIPNVFTRNWIEANLPDNIDGELIVPDSSFSVVSGAMSRHEGEPNFQFCAFDFVATSLDRPYESRMTDLAQLQIAEAESDRLLKLLPVEIRTLDELRLYEEWAIGEGFEGLILRSPTGRYKCGRGTIREGLIWKLKRWEDAEAIVLRVDEGMHNANEATKDAFGRTKRSTAKAGMVARNTFGSFWVRDLTTGVEFSVSGGGGKTAEWIWANREECLGRIIKYKYQPSGMKDRPRFPGFLAFREAWDMEGVSA